MKKILIFGASGSIGKNVEKKFIKKKWKTIKVSRHNYNKNYIVWNPLEKISKTSLAKLLEEGPFDAVCWSQGVNFNDNIENYNQERHEDINRANVSFILSGLKFLLKKKLINNNSKLCVISSIWQDISRNNKLSYSISKSALKGLVLSLSNELGKKNILINAILPGPINSFMTRRNLTKKQINLIKNSTNFKKLISLQDVSNTVYFLCSDFNTAITGNFIKLDYGFTNVRNI